MQRIFIREIIILFFLAIFLYIWRLGSYGLIDPDEGRYAEAAREMLELKDYFIPHLNYQPRLNKPILFYWLILLSYSIFGINEFAARLPSAVAGIASIFGLYFFLKKYKGHRVAFFSSLILLFSLQPLIIAHIAIIDSCFSLFLMLTLFAFWRFYKEDGSFYPFFLFSGISFILKGPVAIILPILIVVFFALLSRSSKPLKIFLNPGGWLLFSLIAFPWYLVVAAKTGLKEFWEFAFQETWGRFGEGFVHRAPFYYYIPVLSLGFFPWCIYLFFLSPSFKALGKEDIIKFLISWIVTVFVFFSLCHTKLPTYILPLYPALAGLTGCLLSLKCEEKGKGFILLSFFIFLLILGVGFSYLKFSYSIFWDEIKNLAVLYFISSSLLLFFLKANLKYQFYTWIFVLCLCYYFGFSKATDLLSSYRSPKEVAGFISSQADVYSYRTFSPALLFYLKRRIYPIGELREVNFKNGDYIFLKKEYVEDLISSGLKAEPVFIGLKYCLFQLQKLRI